MLDVSENAARAQASNGPGTAPDWALVPFEVRCGRCGHDLHGLTEPRCPDCGLDFDWDEAVPLEALKCPACDYRLVGLIETRCPECGQVFSWESVVAAAHRRRLPLFEWHWRHHPVTSLLRTWWRTMRPGRFWAKMNLHDRPRPAPLLVMALLAFVPVAVAMPVLGTAYWVLLVLVKWRSSVTLDWVLRAVRWSVESLSEGPLALGLCWAAATLGSLLIFRWSMKRINVRSVQVLRVWAYCIPAWPMVLLIAAGYLVTAVCIPIMGTRVYDAVIPKWYLALNLFLVGFITMSLWQGYKRYLRMPHPAAVAVASQVIAAMAALVLWKLLCGGRPEYVIDFVADTLLGQGWAD